MKILPNGIAVIEGDGWISKWVEMHGRLDHDQWLLSQVSQYIFEGDTVVDIGANIGDHTKAYLDYVGPSGKVYAIEPNPIAFECLQHNCPAAELYNVALGDIDQSACRLVTENNNIGATYTIVDDSGGVKVMMLDELPLRRCDYIKIDVEGFECSVLSGGEATIKRFNPIMLVEVTANNLLRQGKSEKELLEIIKDFGYSTRILQPDSPLQYDLLCYK